MTNAGQWNTSSGLSCSDSPDLTVGTKKYYYSHKVSSNQFENASAYLSVAQTATVTFANAESNCASYGMTLPTFENQAEYDALRGTNCE